MGSTGFSPISIVPTVRRRLAHQIASIYRLPNVHRSSRRNAICEDILHTRLLGSTGYQACTEAADAVLNTKAYCASNGFNLQATATKRAEKQQMQCNIQGCLAHQMSCGSLFVCLFVCCLSVCLLLVQWGQVD